MARIVIVGAGIIGMSIASLLPRDHSITIVAKDLPGDELTIEWASPWAGADYVAGGTDDPREQRMQLDAYAQLAHWVELYPESSLRFITMDDYYDDEEMKHKMWWKVLPEFKFLPSDKLPVGAKVGASYKTIVLNPAIFLPWLRKRLEDSGVKFDRRTLSALSEVYSSEVDVVINATGFGSGYLTDIDDHNVEVIRGQTILIKSDYSKAFMHDTGDTYTYVIPRLDGTAIIGGVRQPGLRDPSVSVEVEQDIVNRVHKNLPEYFSSNLADYEIVRHNVGLRTGRKTGIRVEKEVREGQQIVHAYGIALGGYIYSFGIARAVRDLVEEFLFPVTAR